MKRKGKQQQQPPLQMKVEYINPLILPGSLENTKQKQKQKKTKKRTTICDDRQLVMNLP